MFKLKWTDAGGDAKGDFFENPAAALNRWMDLRSQGMADITCSQTGGGKEFPVSIDQLEGFATMETTRFPGHSLADLKPKPGG